MSAGIDPHCSETTGKKSYPRRHTKDDEGPRRKQEREKEIHQGHELTPFRFRRLVSAPSARRFTYMDAQDAQDYRPQSPCPDCGHPASRFARVSFFCSSVSSSISCSSCLSMFNNPGLRIHPTGSLFPIGHEDSLFHSRTIRPVAGGGGTAHRESTEFEVSSVRVVPSNTSRMT